MDESIGMLSVVTVLVLGIWLVDYSGDVSRASAGVRAAGIEAAHYAADSLSSAPSRATPRQLSTYASEIAERIVGAAAIGQCDTSDPDFAVDATIHRLAGSSAPAAVSVDVVCPLLVSPLFTDEITTRVAVPVPPRPELRR